MDTSIATAGLNPLREKNSISRWPNEATARTCFGFVLMVVSDKWSTYKEDDVDKARSVKDKLLVDFWWDNVKYIVDFTEPIYSMLRAADIDKPCLHLIYEMWDNMIEKVKDRIYRHERQPDEESAFYDTIYAILYDRWLKSNTPLHCLAHSLNPR